MLKLKAVGIPSEALPVTDKSDLLVDDHLAWVAARQKKEEEAEQEPARKRSRAERGNKADAISVTALYDIDTTAEMCSNSSSFYIFG